MYEQLLPSLLGSEEIDIDYYVSPSIRDELIFPKSERLHRIVSSASILERRDVDVAAADHGERIRRREEAGRRQFGDGLLASIDQVGVFLALVREGAHPEHAVLALQLHAHPLGNVI